MSLNPIFHFNSFIQSYFQPLALSHTHVLSPSFILFISYTHLSSFSYFYCLFNLTSYYTFLNLYLPLIYSFFFIKLSQLRRSFFLSFCLSLTNYLNLNALSFFLLQAHKFTLVWKATNSLLNIMLMVIILAYNIIIKN